MSRVRQTHCFAADRVSSFGDLINSIQGMDKGLVLCGGLRVCLPCLGLAEELRERGVVQGIRHGVHHDRHSSVRVEGPLARGRGGLRPLAQLPEPLISRGNHGICEVRRDGIEPPTRGFSVLKEGPETLEKTPHFSIPYPPNVRSIALAQLQAVAEGREGEAGELTQKLAEAIVASPLVLAALAVREGGPLAIARGVRLAEQVLALVEVGPHAEGARSA